MGVSQAQRMESEMSGKSVACTLPMTVQPTRVSAPPLGPVMEASGAA